jgi:hypothetical protein
VYGNFVARLVGISGPLVETVPADVFAADPDLAVAAVLIDIVQQSFVELIQLFPASGYPHEGSQQVLDRNSPVC